MPTAVPVDDGLADRYAITLISRVSKMRTGIYHEVDMSGAAGKGMATTPQNR